MNAFCALESALACMGREGLGFVPLRVRPLRPEVAYEKDYDLLTHPRSHGRVVAAFRDAAKAHGASLLVENPHAAKTLILLADDLRRGRIAVDLWREHEIRWGAGERAFLSYEEVHPHVVREEGMPRLPADLELLLHVCHLETKQRAGSTPDTRNRLLEVARRTEEEPHPLEQDPGVRARWAALAREVADGSEVRAAADRCRTELGRRGMARGRRARADMLGVRAREALRRRIASRLHHPVVAVVGPDGAGKSTLLQALRDRWRGPVEVRTFKALFRHTRVYAAVTARHPAYRREPPNVVDERLGPLWFWVAWANYPREVGTGRHGGVLLFDRFFHDLLLAGVRTATGGVRMPIGRRLAAAVFPLPDAVVQVHAPAEVIVKRKPELPPEGVARYDDLVSAIYLRREPRWFAQLSTDRPLEETVAFCRLLAGRMGWPGAGGEDAP